MKTAVLLSIILVATGSICATAAPSVPVTKVAAASEFAKASANNIYFSTNFIDLSQGRGNFGADFIASDKVSAAIRFRTSAEKETVTKDGEKGKLAVERTSYTLGISYFPLGMKEKINILISPGIAFGVKKDPIDVETMNGLNLKLTALLLFRQNLAAEVGLRGDNLDDGVFKSDLYAGLGYLF